MPDVDGLGIVDVAHDPIAGILRHMAELPAAQVDPTIGVTQVDDSRRRPDKCGEYGDGNGPKQSSMFESGHFG